MQYTFKDIKSASKFESILKSYDNVYYIKYNSQSKPTIVNEFTLYGDNELIFFILKSDSIVSNTIKSLQSLQITIHFL